MYTIFFTQICKMFMRALTQLKAEIIKEIHLSFHLILICERPVYQEEKQSLGHLDFVSLVFLSKTKNVS